MWKRVVCGLLACLMMLSCFSCGAKPKPDPDPIDVAITVNKTLTGRDLADGEFLFELKDAEGKTIGTAANDKSGKVSFSPIS